MKYPIGMTLNRTWLAFANRKRCRHADAIHSLGFISWRMGRARFSIGDIVYLFHYCPVKILDLEINRVDHHPLGR